MEKLNKIFLLKNKLDGLIKDEKLMGFLETLNNEDHFAFNFNELNTKKIQDRYEIRNIYFSNISRY